MKLIYSNLQFELTRRCNEACAHCCRGEAQDIDLTKETIDNFFNNNDIHTISTLMFSGGEPTLNGKMLEYIVDKIIEKDIIVHMFMISINGLSYSEELINGLNKLKDYIISKNNKVRCPGILFISQSQFHKDADEEVIKKLEELSYFAKVEKEIIPDDELIPYGRAYENGLSSQKPNLEDLTNYEKNYRVKNNDGIDYLFINYQYMAANGNIINDGIQSYDLMDEYSLGNVNKQNIEDMYLNNKSKTYKIT